MRLKNEFIAFWGSGWAKKRGQVALPSRIPACAALGSLSSVALSSGQAKAFYSVSCDPANLESVNHVPG